ncbi:transmembrane protein [Cystoisospora suis]|uniref:Transmembrane protein n=1 Tax=Cystoisospora suis TaxID=483139 RepID=A0A2C6LCM9_9APIC|nr:transmembrane protein [Cystoisospora suis]
MTRKYALQEMITAASAHLPMSKLQLFIVVSLSWAAALWLPAFGPRGMKGLESVLPVVVATFLVCVPMFTILFEALDAICATVVMSWVRAATDITWDGAINSVGLKDKKS